MRLALLGVALLLASCLPAPTTSPAACPQAAPSAQEATAILADAQSALVRTSLGDFIVALRGDVAPIATANFVALARCGFYDGITFHRVLADFVIQAGDPQTRDNHGDFSALGTGGPGYHFAIELPPADLGYDQYVMAMANAGQPDTNGSQFFICLVDLNGRLDRAYTIFGRATSGLEVVDAIGAVAVNDPTAGVPLDAVLITGIEISSQSGIPEAS